MPPKKSASTVAEGSASGTPVLTQNEYGFIGSMLRHMNSKPDVDWEAVSQDCGLKDAKCTKERYRQMSVKHGWNSTAKKPADGPAVGKTPTNKVTKPRAPKKKKRKKEPEPAMEGVDDGEISSIKAEVKEEDSDV